MKIFQRDHVLTREEQLERARKYLTKQAEKDAEGAPSGKHALGFLAQRRLDYIKELDVITESDKKELYSFYRSELGKSVDKVIEGTGIIIRSTFPEY